ncbi:MAG TPA: ribose 5-phosphate isomerase B [Eubacteriaceae bacterium]|nr:ribose 5-phosphate isomerase B [Eubacteriaceae bacterium]
MKIGLGADHGGFELKEAIKEHLQEKGFEVEDYGTYTEESVDYPEIGEKVANAVAAGEVDRGIVMCGTGLGISISANKVPGIRAALVSESFSARLSIEHNNANVLALGGRVTGKDLALEIVDVWLTAQFEGGRHARRVGKIGDIEAKYKK